MLMFCILVLAPLMGGKSVSIFHVSIMRSTNASANLKLGAAAGLLFSLLRYNSDPSFLSTEAGWLSWRNGKRQLLQMIAGGSSDTQRVEYIEWSRMFLAS